MKSQKREERRSERYNVFLPLVIESNGNQIIGRSRNLSTGGASISLVDPINSEDIEDNGSVTIRTSTGNINAPYQITYRKENVIGIRFGSASALSIDTLNSVCSNAAIGDSYSVAANDGKKPLENKSFLQRLNRRLWIGLRMAGFLAINLCWPLIKRAVKPEVVFAVYGTRGDQRAYFPDWFRKICPPIVVAAYISDKSSRGVMVSSVFSEEELAADSNNVRKYISDLQKEFPNVNRFALVGRLPGFSMKAGINLEAPLVDGSFGTRFAMYESAMQIAEKLRANLTEKSDNKTWGYSELDSIAILGGAGRIGGALIEDLCQSFSTVIAIDPRYTEEETKIVNGATVIYTKRGERLKDTKLALVLTAQGNDIQPMINHFSPGTVVADDTHPCIKRPIRNALKRQGVELWKTVVTSDDYNMLPRMPNFRKDNIPGCLLEALVLNASGDQALSTPEHFFEEAKRCGYRTMLIRHPDDS